MSAEMTSLKRRLLFKEEEVQILKDMVAEKDEEIKRLRVDKHDDVLQDEKDPSSLEPMSAEMTSLKSRLVFKKEEVQILKDMVAQKDEEIKRLRLTDLKVQILEDMVAQKDEEIKRLKDTLSERDLKVDVLRADVESAWKKFDTYLSVTSPERSKNEIKHEKEPGEEEIKGMARKQDEIVEILK